MKAHNLEALGFLKLHYTPTEPNHAVRKEDLDKLFHSTSQRPIFVTDIYPTDEGNVGSKQYADTTPPNQLVTGCVTDTSDITISFLCESNTSFKPPEVTVWFNDTLIATAPEVIGVEGSPTSFVGNIPIAVPGNGTLIVKSSQGSEAEISISIATSGPVIQNVSVTSLPGTQTAVKSGDLISVEGSVDNTAVKVVPLSSGAAISSGYDITLGEPNSASEGFRSFFGTVTTSSASGPNTVSMFAENQLGTKGKTISSEPIQLDQSVPVVDVTLSGFSNGAEALGLNDTFTATFDYSNVERSELTFDYGTFEGEPDALLDTRTLTVSIEAYNMQGGLAVKAWKDSNGTYREFVFDVPIVSQQASVTSFEITGSVLRGSSQVISSLPKYGSSQLANISASDIDGLINSLPSTNNQDFFLEAPVGYGYFAYPAALGQATFIDMSTGNVGGWDGATWPSDGSVGSTSGPATVTKNGEEWYVYRTDFPGIVTPVLVSFQNPGLEVGNAAPIPHLRSSNEGIEYELRLEFDQDIPGAPALTLPVGSWSSTWNKQGNAWARKLLIKDSDSRGVVAFSDFNAFNLSGSEVTNVPDLSYAVAGFTSRTLTFSALSRTASIGVPVYNATNTRVGYSGSSSLLELRTDTRDARASYSIVDSEDNYKASMGTHLWLSDVDFASANTSGTLQLDIEELS